VVCTIATIPTGWVLCNGSNSTPDLRNRFVIGAHSDTAGVAYTTVTGSNTQTGGTKDAIVVSHTHTASVSDPGHAHSYNQPVQSNAANPPGASGSQASSTTTGTAVTNLSVTNASTGSSGTDQNLPPYYALAFIMKT
jgi:microcystin-dependent protein